MLMLIIMKLIVAMLSLTSHAITYPPFIFNQQRCQRVREIFSADGDAPDAEPVVYGALVRRFLRISFLQNTSHRPSHNESAFVFALWTLHLAFSFSRAP